MDEANAKALANYNLRMAGHNVPFGMEPDQFKPDQNAGNGGSTSQGNGPTLGSTMGVGPIAVPAAPDNSGQQTAMPPPAPIGPQPASPVTPDNFMAPPIMGGQQTTAQPVPASVSALGNGASNPSPVSAPQDSSVAGMQSQISNMQAPAPIMQPPQMGQNAQQPQAGQPTDAQGNPMASAANGVLPGVAAKLAEDAARTQHLDQLTTRSKHLDVLADQLQDGKLQGQTLDNTIKGLRVNVLQTAAQFTGMLDQARLDNMKSTMSARDAATSLAQERFAFDKTFKTAELAEKVKIDNILHMPEGQARTLQTELTKKEFGQALQYQNQIRQSALKVDHQIATLTAATSGVKPLDEATGDPIHDAAARKFNQNLQYNQALLPQLQASRKSLESQSNAISDHAKAIAALGVKTAGTQIQSPTGAIDSRATKAVQGAANSQLNRPMPKPPGAFVPPGPGQTRNGITTRPKNYGDMSDADLKKALANKLLGK